MSRDMEDINMNTWKSPEREMPPSSKEVLLKCQCEYDYYYCCVGYHVDRYTDVCNTIAVDDDDSYEYSEEYDEYYYKEGWYESVHNWGEYTAVTINDLVMAWMPLPLEKGE